MPKWPRWPRAGARGAGLERWAANPICWPISSLAAALETACCAGAPVHPQGLARSTRAAARQLASRLCRGEGPMTPAADAGAIGPRADRLAASRGGQTIGIEHQKKLLNVSSTPPGWVERRHDGSIARAVQFLEQPAGVVELPGLTGIVKGAGARAPTPAAPALKAAALCARS